MKSELLDQIRRRSVGNSKSKTSSPDFEYFELRVKT